MASNENPHVDPSSSPKGTPGLYRPLSLKRGEIRIFLLQPSSRYESEICGKLGMTSLRDRTKIDPPPDEQFEALSYTWGTEWSCNKIIVDGIAMPIKSNLEAFLRQRRKADQVVPLWIDALCINQEDDQEKSEQVPTMNTIYSVAERLVIWLGPADADSDLAMQNLNGLGASSPYHPLPVLSRKVLESFRHLFSRPWWSRVWIIQEVVMGGAGQKLEKIVVLCGGKRILWVALVVAAARLWSYQAERRQYFPNVQAILTLDRLRNNSAEPILNNLRPVGSPQGNASISQWAIGLVSDYRHFQATDARDKVYALANMFSFYHRKAITPDYTSPANGVYEEFATWALQHCSGLELLRHCGSRALDIPSWVPDWSVAHDCLRLPSKNRSRLRGEPWWAQPNRESDESDKSTSPSSEKKHPVRYYNSPWQPDQKKHARRRLEIAAKGFGIVRDINDIPRNYNCYNYMKRLPDDVKELFDTNKCVFIAGDSGPSIDDSLIQSEEDLMRLQERELSRPMQQQLLEEVQEPPYQAAGATSHNFYIINQTLTVEGVIWDEIESVHDGFVSNIDADFENTTRFMVALGQCKAMAEDSLSVTRRLPVLEERLKSFWLSILAGRTGTSDLSPPSEELSETFSLDNEVSEYMSWLPPIPSTWKPGTPPVTATTNGLLELAERLQRMNIALARIDEIMKENGYSAEDSYRFSDLSPEEWTASEREMYQHKFRELGWLWSEQRFDLYHSPFDLFNVVPDPYWDIRKDHDEVARWKSNQWFSDMQVAFVPGGGHDYMNHILGDESQQAVQFLKKEMQRLWSSTISRVPRGTLGAGFEKYALGRKFFITKKGYFGIGSKEAKQGDKVVVLFGSDVPFVLRRGGVAGNRTWQMIGEAYVDGIMNGEVLNQVDLGNVQPSMIRIT